MSLRFEQVTKAFNGRRVLDQISFEIQPGEVAFILGKSGMGKSVTLKHLTGFMQADQGEVFVENFNVTEVLERKDSESLAAIRQKCGMVFQHPALLDSLTLYQNISFGLRTAQFVKKNNGPLHEDAIRKRSLECLKAVHLDEEILDNYPHEVSYGIQKRISLARTLAPGPSYLLFDEPTTGLDPESTASINALIDELSRKFNVTSLVVSHDMACALSIADQILFLDQGKIIFRGTPEETLNCNLELVKDFFSEARGLLPPDWSLK